MNEVAEICLYLIIILLFLLGISRYIIYRNSPKMNFLTRKRFQRINWKKLFRMWVFLQLIIIFLSIESLKENLLFVIVLPILIVVFVLVNLFTSPPNPEWNETESELGEEWDIHKKAFYREKKINKILRRF
jgi:cell division protein FtsW (lipid II flippase)